MKKLPTDTLRKIIHQAIQPGIKKYCLEQGYEKLELTDQELNQLSWYLDSKIVTPEARGEDIYNHLHFEIKRGLARRYSFELLLIGNKEAYEQFIQAQSDKLKLSFDDFQALSQEAQLLPDDLQAAIRASCFLTKTEKADKKLTAAGYEGFIKSQDSELFLTELSPLVLKHPNIMPITSCLTQESLKYFSSMFWPTTHFRHMIYTEGGDNMTTELKKGIEKGTFVLKAWQWRWLTNLMGFQGGPAAKYFNAETYALVKMVLSALKNSIDHPDQSFLDGYLIQRAEMAGLTKPELNSEEHKLLGHIAAYGNAINILTPDMGQPIFEGYLKYKELSNDTGQLAEHYKNQREDEKAITPTYVPAVFNSAYALFSKELKDSVPDTMHPLFAATIFTCQTLAAIYSQPHDKRISCRDLGWSPNLEPVLKDWLDANMQIQFAIKGDGIDVSLAPIIKQPVTQNGMK